MNKLNELILLRTRDLEISFNTILENLKNRFFISMDRIVNYKIETSINNYKINSLTNEIINLFDNNLKEIKYKLENYEISLNHLDINKIFSKGFFLTQLKSDKSIIKSFKNIKKGDQILVSNLNETLEAETIKINDKGKMASLHSSDEVLKEKNYKFVNTNAKFKYYLLNK